MKIGHQFRVATVGIVAMTLALAAHSTAVAGRQAAQIVFVPLQGTVVKAGGSEPLADVKISVDISAEQTRALRDAMQRGGAGIPPQIQQALQAAPARGTGGATPPASPFSAVTDSAGHFTITVPEGPVTVHAQLDGYFGPLAGGVSPGTADATAVASAQQPGTVRLELTPGGTITGRVTDQTGKIMVEAVVFAGLRTFRNGQPAIDFVGATQTDDRGNYRLYRLPPGQYAVAVLQNRDTASGPRPSGPIEKPVATFFPGVVDFLQAQVIDLKGGDELAGMDMQVRTALTYSISGRVVSQLPPGSVNPNRPTTAFLTVLPHESTGLPDTNAGVVNANADGTFEIRGVMPGSYDLIARLPSATGWGPANGPDRAQSPWAFGRASVDVVAANVENVNITVHQGVDLKGRLTVDGKAMPAAVKVMLQVDDNNLSYTGFFQTIGNWAPFIESDGSFLVPMIPEGHYRVRVALTTGPTRVPTPNAQGQLPPTPVPVSSSAYVADVTQGGRSVYDTGLVVTGDVPAPIEVLLRTDGGTVDGVVTGADGKPVPNTSVVLVPDTRRQNTNLYKVASSDLQGRFSMTRVAPGSYKAFAWMDVAAGAYQNAEFLSRYESRGAPVRVTTGAARVDLTVIR